MNRAKKAFKFSLSMFLAYWLALYMNWELPQYAGLAVLLISLDNTKASFRKGVLRIVGTIGGVTVGLIAIEWFAQARFLFMLFFAFYFFFISLLMQRSRFSYAWFVAGFVPILVWSHSYMNYSVSFGYGVYRFLETASGIVIYMIISSLLWPNRDKLPQESKKKLPLFSKELVLKSLISPLAFVIGFIFWILTTTPSNTSFIGFIAVFSLIFLTNPTSPPLFALSMLLAIWLAVAPIYFFIMPALAGGPMILLVIFLFSFLFGYLGSWSPVYKLPPMLMFILLTNITNQQSYSFLSFANASIATLLAIYTIWIVQIFITKNIFYDMKKKKQECSS